MSDIERVKKEYKVILEDSTSDLADRVEYYMRNGWEPLGGVSLSIFRETNVTETWVAQAMIRIIH